MIKTTEQLLSIPASIEDTIGGPIRLHMKSGKMISCPTYTSAVAWLSGYATAMDEVKKGIESLRDVEDAIHAHV